jgi:hypothetical protein
LNPYETPTDLIFHKDLTFTGAASTARFGLGDGSPEQSHLFLTVGAHQLQEIEFSADDKWLVAAELGANLRLGETQRLRLAGGFFDFFNVTGRLNPAGEPGLYNYTAPQFMRWGNTVFNIDSVSNPTEDLFAYASKFRIGNVNAIYTVNVAGPYQLSFTVDTVKNFGFNVGQIEALTGNPVSPNRNTGAQTELAFGYPTVLGTRGAWRALVGYRYLRGDAVMDEYTDSDFHYFGGTNAKGYYVVVDYGLTTRVYTRLRYLSANEIDGPRFGVDTLQIDLSTRF